MRCLGAAIARFSGVCLCRLCFAFALPGRHAWTGRVFISDWRGTCIGYALHLHSASSFLHVGILEYCADPSVVYRSAAGVLVSDPKGRDIKIDQYTLSFHGRLLIEGAEVSLNYGQRYGLLGDNGSGKVRRSAHAPPYTTHATACSRRSSNRSQSATSRSRNTSISTSSAARPSRQT